MVPHAVHVQFVASHQRLVVLVLDVSDHLLLGHVNSEVEVAEEDLDVVVFQLVTLVLSPSFCVEALSEEVRDLLVTFFDVARVAATGQVAVDEDKAGVFEAKAHHNSSLVARVVTGGWFHKASGDVEYPRLRLGLCD